MKLLLDANLSWRLTKVLSSHFVETKHILDFFEHNAQDFPIWQLAKKENYTIVTNDEDFVGLVALRGWPPKVILLKTGNQSNKYLCSLLIAKKTEIETFIANSQLGVLLIA